MSTTTPPSLPESWRPTLQEAAECADPRLLLTEVEQMVVDRVDALVRTSRKGCGVLQLLAMQFELERAMANFEARSERGFLDDQRIMAGATYYDSLNHDDKRTPLMYMLGVRALLQARIAHLQSEEGKE